MRTKKDLLKGYGSRTLLFKNEMRQENFFSFIEKSGEIFFSRENHKYSYEDVNRLTWSTKSFNGTVDDKTPAKLVDEIRTLIRTRRKFLTFFRY